MQAASQNNNRPNITAAVPYRSYFWAVGQRARPQEACARQRGAAAVGLAEAGREAAEGGRLLGRCGPAWPVPATATRRPPPAAVHAAGEC